MTILDRYVVSTFLSSFLILLGVGAGLFILGDVLVNIDEFAKTGMTLGELLRHMADYYGYNLPLYFSQLCGVAIAIAASYTVANMLRNNEMTALVAAGMPLQRIAAPILLSSIALITVWWCNQEYVLPNIAPKVARQREDVFSARQIGLFCVRDKHNHILTALNLDPRKGTLEKVFIIEPDENGRPARLVEADFAAYDAAGRMWHLTRGRRITMKDVTGTAGGLGTPVRYEPVQTHPYDLSPEQLVLRQASEWSDLLSLRQMNALVAAGQQANRPTIVMKRHIRLTQPIVQLLLLALALPFFLTREPTNVLAAGGQALLMTGLFFVTAFIAQSMIRESWAALLAWFPIIVFGPVAVVQLANVKT
ncbi:MAG: LptF/LptG family permease [Phycisphaerales bacterium]|nr:LptF/LptG family permease [Phycisphaerales bacterium]